jgi:DNA-binding CsgD family transcriptional regulator
MVTQMTGSPSGAVAMPTHAVHGQQGRDVGMILRATAKSAEMICALPAVATQDWCDRAAASLLPLVGSGVALTMLGQVDERGHIVRQEATGVAGAASVDLTTTVGGTRGPSNTQVLAIDQNDANLVRVRTNLAQTRDLHWSPGASSAGHSRVGTPEKFGASIMDPISGLTKRWDAYRLSGMLVGIAWLGTGGRALVVEIGSTNSAIGELEIGALEAVLPLLSRRAVMAIGAEATEAAHWLTSREQMILQHLLLGKSVREIAEELGRSPHTVHDHVKSLHRKLNASSRGELVARALGHAEMLQSKRPENGASHGLTVQTRIGGKAAPAN